MVNLNPEYVYILNWYFRVKNIYLFLIVLFTINFLQSYSKLKKKYNYY